MNIQVILSLALLGAASAFPSNIVDFETDTMDIEQEGIPGKAVEGEYSWRAPNGQEVYVKYVADNRGFRVLEDENTFAGGSDFDSYRREEEEEVPVSVYVAPDVAPAAEVRQPEPISPVEEATPEEGAKEAPAEEEEGGEEEGEEEGGEEEEEEEGEEEEGEEEEEEEEEEEDSDGGSK